MVSYINQNQQASPTPTFCNANFDLFCHTGREKMQGEDTFLGGHICQLRPADKLIPSVLECVGSVVRGPTRVISLPNDVVLSENRYLEIHFSIISSPYIAIWVGSIPQFVDIKSMPVISHLLICHPNILSYTVIHSYTVIPF